MAHLGNFAFHLVAHCQNEEGKRLTKIIKGIIYFTPLAQPPTMMKTLNTKGLINRCYEANSLQLGFLRE